MPGPTFILLQPAGTMVIDSPGATGRILVMAEKA